MPKGGYKYFVKGYYDFDSLSNSLSTLALIVAKADRTIPADIETNAKTNNPLITTAC
jgi:hypothetical protein